MVLGSKRLFQFFSWEPFWDKSGSNFRLLNICRIIVLHYNRLLNYISDFLQIIGKIGVSLVRNDIIKNLIGPIKNAKIRCFVVTSNAHSKRPNQLLHHEPMILIRLVSDHGLLKKHGRECYSGWSMS